MRLGRSRGRITTVAGWAVAPFALVVAAGADACSPSSGAPADPPCVQGLTTSCAAQYDPPAFATIFDKILHPTCATGRGTCHTADTAPNGLVFETADDSYRLLLDGRRVLPGDPSCSLLMKRLTSTDPSYHMPKGSLSLSPGEECTIVKWISAGAAR